MKDTIRNPKIFNASLQIALYVIIEKDSEGWFESEVVELPGCHTQAKSIEQLMERTKEAIKVYLETEEMPEISDEFIGVKQIVV